MVCDYLSLQPDPNSGHIIYDVSLVYCGDVDKTFKLLMEMSGPGRLKSLEGAAKWSKLAKSIFCPLTNIWGGWKFRQIKARIGSW
jgi:hypothetical protein